MDISSNDLKLGKIVITAKAKPKEEHQRRYNEQLNLQEVRILKNTEPHDLVLQLRGGSLQDVSDLNPKGMPLHFTLLFPYGTYGWDPNKKHADGKRRITTREFYVYHINQRDNGSDFLHMAKRLFQEWCCMGWIAVENQKLMYQRLNQKALRADTYQNIRETTDKIRADLIVNNLQWEEKFCLARWLVVHGGTMQNFKMEWPLFENTINRIFL